MPLLLVLLLLVSLLLVPLLSAPLLLVLLREPAGLWTCEPVDLWIYIAHSPPGARMPTPASKEYGNWHMVCF